MTFLVLTGQDLKPAALATLCRMTRVQRQVSPEGALPAAIVIHLALCMGVVLFAGVTAYLRSSGVMTGSDPTLALALGAAGGGLLVVAAGFAAMAPRILAAKARRAAAEAASPEAGEQVIAGHWIQLVISRLAMFQAAALLTVVGVLVSGEWLLFIGTGLGVLAMIALRPTRADRDRFGAAVLHEPA